MVLLAREEEVPRDGYGRIPRNGAMAVAKDEDFDRAICARKPSNALERPSGLAGSLLPHGSQVCEKQLGRHVDLAVDLEDLRDFYHMCGVTYEHALTTPIGPPLKASVLEGTAALAEPRGSGAHSSLPLHGGLAHAERCLLELRRGARNCTIASMPCRRRKRCRGTRLSSTV